MSLRSLFLALIAGLVPVALGAQPLRVVSGVARVPAGYAPARPSLVVPSSAPARCSRSVPRLALQLGAGLVGAWAGGMGAWTAFDDPEGSGRKVKGDAGYTPNANTAYALGSWMGSAGGAWIAGRDRTACGSFKWALGFTLLPTIPLLLGREEPYLPLLGMVLAAPMQAGLAVGGNQVR